MKQSWKTQSLKISKNAQEVINSRFNDIEECNGNLEDRLGEIPQGEEKKIRIVKYEASLWEFYNIQHTNICIIGVPEWRKRERKAEI